MAMQGFIGCNFTIPAQHAWGNSVASSILPEATGYSIVGQTPTQKLLQNLNITVEILHPQTKDTTLDKTAEAKRVERAKAAESALSISSVWRMVRSVFSPGGVNLLRQNDENDSLYDWDDAVTTEEDLERKVRYTYQKMQSDQENNQTKRACADFNDNVSLWKSPADKWDGTMFYLRQQMASEHVQNSPGDHNLDGRRYNEQESSNLYLPDEQAQIEISDSPLERVWDGRMINFKVLRAQKGGKTVPSKEPLSKVDHNYLQRKGLSDNHLWELTRNGVALPEVIGISKLFPSLKGRDLFDKIKEALEKVPETTSFKRWRKNPEKKCSKDGVKGKKSYPTALILRARDHINHREALDEKSDWARLERLDTVYNLCFRIFSNKETFLNAVKTFERPINLLHIMAHGQQNAIKAGDHAFLTTRMRDSILSAALSRLAPGADIFILGCETGMRKEQEMNMANFLYINAPSGVRVSAPTKSFYGFQVFLTKASATSMRVGFWNYRDESQINSLPVSQNIYDDTYIVDSSTNLKFLES
jgi:hypothetical protein